MTKRYYEAVKTLEELFDQFNEYLFENEIERPIITILPDTTSGAYGWCTTQKVWKTDDEEYYEINICAEHLNRSIKEVCGTLIHEMVHLHNIHKGIKDTSANGRYHNKKFKETAEARGLIIEKVDKYGWTKTSLQPSTEAWIDENIKIDGFNLARVKEKKSKSVAKKNTTIIYAHAAKQNSIVFIKSTLLAKIAEKHSYNTNKLNPSNSEGLIFYYNICAIYKVIRKC